MLEVVLISTVVGGILNASLWGGRWLGQQMARQLLR